MIEIRWMCDECPAETKTKTSFDPFCWEFKSNAEPPRGWGYVIEETVLRCPKCIKTRMKKYRKENPDAVAIG